VAMGAHAIVEEPGTLTGSIGVFGGKFCLRGLYDKVGMRKEELQRGRHAALFSDYRPWSDEERQRIRAILGAFYGEFVRKAAEGRGRKGEEIEAVAQGRVWTGASALSHGLIDQLGGLSAALDLAREKAGLGKDRSVVLLTLPERKGLLDLLLERNQPSVLLAALPTDMQSLLRMVRAAQGSVVLARLPFEVEVE
jgi:protease-4